MACRYAKVMPLAGIKKSEQFDTLALIETMRSWRRAIAGIKRIIEA